MLFISHSSSGCSFFIPLEQGLKQIVLFQHISVIIPLDQGLKLEEIALIRFLLSSFFIPLEQGLKHHIPV